MVCVMTIPTGIGCTIGGHAGDATPVARLLAEACDVLIVHPNVVNASDVCELTENMLYVEGSILDRFLEGHVGLKRVTSNRILLACNRPVQPATLNAANVARSTLGARVSNVVLETPLRMVARYDDDGIATGTVTGVEELAEQVSRLEFDALAVHSPIDCPRDVAARYYASGGVNPWGGVEAIASRAIARAIDKPTAHAPLETLDHDDPLYHIGTTDIVDRRMAAEALSVAHLHCVLKGLHRAPRIEQERPDLTVRDVDALVVPSRCYGPAHAACLRHGIPVIAVRENATVLRRHERAGTTVVDDYLQAAGTLLAIRAGVTLR